MGKIRFGVLSSAVTLAAAALWAGGGPVFEKHHITPVYWSEGANLADFNKDGQMDVVCGAHIYLGPDYQFRHEFYPAVAPTKPAPNAYPVYSMDNFFSFVHDFNRDGWSDVLTVGFPGTPAYWYENPAQPWGGPPQTPVHWKRHLVFERVGNESPALADLVGDAWPELLFGYDGRLGYATADPSDPRRPWTFHPISPAGQGPRGRFGHGLGYGDIDGDGRTDLLSKDGWWQQPASLQGDPDWVHHAYDFAQRGGAQMLVYDVNGDGRNDVITSLDAHGWGLSWFEQVRSPSGAIDFKEHVLLSPAEENLHNPHGVQFSQLHALELVDLDGDGLKDILTGKTYRAHDFKDPGSRQPAVLYVFRLTRQGNQVYYIPHRIDDNSGVGRQVVSGDLNNDGRPDIVIGNKNGTFVFLQRAGDAD